MSPGSNTESYPAFAHIGLRENPGKNLNQSWRVHIRFEVKCVISWKCEEKYFSKVACFRRKKFYNVKNMDIVKVEPDEEEPVKGWLPPVKPEPQDPLDVNDERRESWGWNLNVIDSSSIHTQAKNEDLPWNAPEVKEELTIEDYELKLPGTKHVADNINTVTLKVEADEESVKIQLPPVKTEFQDPLDVTDEGVVPWKWNLNVTDSSFVHKQMKVEIPTHSKVGPLHAPNSDPCLVNCPKTGLNLTSDTNKTPLMRKNTVADNERKKEDPGRQKLWLKP
ncbi:hypothetical protein ANN_12356 [Periplaneta americana]|uniref:Uncharacterized protein n=1 Tax=Periplaneta americana TaxID=6978 RepID=A0ABQ8TI97_PERAM|nr:hypothetical protein ANN_12356 [Periplaneta americana]